MTLTEAFARRCSVKKVFLKVLQKSQKNIYGAVSGQLFLNLSLFQLTMNQFYKTVSIIKEIMGLFFIIFVLNGKYDNSMGIRKRTD